MLCGLRWEMGSLNSNLTFSRNSWLFLRLFIFFIFLGDASFPSHTYIHIYLCTHSLVFSRKIIIFNFLHNNKSLLFASYWNLLYYLLWPNKLLPVLLYALLLGHHLLLLPSYLFWLKTFYVSQNIFVYQTL